MALLIVKTASMTRESQPLIRRLQLHQNSLEPITAAGTLTQILVEAYTCRGHAYRDRAELDSAIADYSEAIKRKPKVAESYWIRAEAWLLSKGWEEAKTDLTAALLQDVDVAAAFHNIYESIAAFERKIGVHLPKEIAELLTPRSEPFKIDRTYAK